MKGLFLLVCVNSKLSLMARGEFEATLKGARSSSSAAANGHLTLVARSYKNSTRVRTLLAVLVYRKVRVEDVPIDDFDHCSCFDASPNPSVRLLSVDLYFSSLLPREATC
jgi:hypothetical protein